MKLKQHGFSAVEGLIVIVVVAALGVVGYTVISSNNDDDSNEASNSEMMEEKNYDGYETLASDPVPLTLRYMNEEGADSAWEEVVDADDSIASEGELPEGYEANSVSIVRETTETSGSDGSTATFTTTESIELFTVQAPDGETLTVDNFAELFEQGGISLFSVSEDRELAGETWRYLEASFFGLTFGAYIQAGEAENSVIGIGVGTADIDSDETQAILESVSKK